MSSDADNGNGGDNDDRIGVGVDVMEGVEADDDRSEVVMLASKRYSETSVDAVDFAGERRNGSCDGGGVAKA